jgi:hypothetical protein
MKLLLEGFKIKEDRQDDFIQTAFLRLDRSFLNHMVHYMNYRDNWLPDDVLIMVEAALSSGDVAYLSLILEHVSTIKLSKQQPMICQLVYCSGSLDFIDAMLQVVIPRPADIAATLAWYLSSGDEQSFRDFLCLIEGRGGSFRSRTHDAVDFSDFCSNFVAGCSRLIETQRPDTLNLFLDSLEGLGINYHIMESISNVNFLQLAVLPALVSPDPSFLRILLERDVIVADLSIPFIDSCEVAQYSFLSWRNWPPYCSAVLVCDTEFLQLLCQHGTFLQQESGGTNNQEIKVHETVRHLTLLSSLENARLEHVKATLFFHELIHLGTNGPHGRHLCYATGKKTENNITDYEETWRSMERLLFRDDFLASCSGPCGVFHEGSWKDDPSIRSEILSRYTKFPDNYPKHLRTQGSWAIWRKDALQILKKLI